MRYQRIRPLGSCGRRTDRRGRAGPRDRVPPGSFLPPPPDDPLPGEQVKGTLRMSLRGRFASLDRSATARELAAMRRTGRRGKPQVNDPICNRRGAMERDRGNGANLAHRDLSHLPRSLHLPEIACDGRDVRRGAHNPEVRIFTAAPKGQRPFPDKEKGLWHVVCARLPARAAPYSCRPSRLRSLWRQANRRLPVAPSWGLVACSSQSPRCPEGTYLLSQLLSTPSWC